MALYDEQTDKLCVYVLETSLTQEPLVPEAVLISVEDTPDIAPLRECLCQVPVPKFGHWHLASAQISANRQAARLSI